jgi:hypothetical protein
VADLGLDPQRCSLHLVPFAMNYTRGFDFRT